MHRKRVAFALSLLRESTAFVTGLVIGRLWEQRQKPRFTLPTPPSPRASDAIADALKRAEKERNARQD